MKLSLKVGGGEVPMRLVGGEVRQVVSGDYEGLANKPSIEGNELVGDRSFEELGLSELSNVEIAAIFKNVMEG